MKKFILSVSLLSFLISCDSTQDNTEVSISNADNKGLELMESKCFVCHNTQGTDNMLAPPMQRVKDHYWNDEISEEEFVSQIVEWCKEPSEDMSKMPGARRKFGLMAKQDFEEADVKAIAKYLYNNDLGEVSCSH